MFQSTHADMYVQVVKVDFDFNDACKYSSLIILRLLIDQLGK